MALDWSIGLHAICVRVELDIKTATLKKGYLLEFTAFMCGLKIGKILLMIQVSVFNIQ
jgi:hypothetical protein